MGGTGVPQPLPASRTGPLTFLLLTAPHPQGRQPFSKWYIGVKSRVVGSASTSQEVCFFFSDSVHRWSLRSKADTLSRMVIRTDITLQQNSVEDGAEKQGGSDSREKGRFPGLCWRRPETDPGQQ